MIRDLVSVGDKLELKKVRISAIELENEKIYRSQLIDFIDNQTIIILMPIEKGRIIPLSVGDKYNVRFFTKKGLYQCNANIINRSKIKNIYVLTLELISELEKKQRREFYRLECVLDIGYYIIADVEIAIMNKIKTNNITDQSEYENYVNALDECKREWFKGIVVDISGGGARFVSDKLHEFGNMIHISVKSDSNIKLQNKWIKAMIISSEKMMNRQGFYEHRIQFKDIIKEDREAIIRYIFEEERKQRNKDKGI